MPRGRYQQVNPVDRNRIINVYEENGDYWTLSAQLGIKRQTVRNIILNFRETGRREALPKGGNRPQSLSNEMIEFVVASIEEQPTITLNEIRQKLIVQYPNWNPCTIQTISRAIDGQLITLKLSRAVPAQWNVPAVKQQRQAYAEWIMAEGMEQNLIFLDEMGCNIWTARTQARAPRGQRAVHILGGQRGRNLTVCLAVSPLWGLVYYKFIRGGMNQQEFSDFVIELSTIVANPFVLIYDNARPHLNPPQLEENQNQRHLPPYSPFLNMTERAISCLKAALKRSLGNRNIQAELGNREIPHNLGINLQEHRLRILQRLLEENMGEITQQKCQQWHNFSMQYVPRCLQNQDIFV